MSAADNCPERLLIIAATGNAHKLSEFARIFGDFFPEGAVDVLSQKRAAELAGSAYCAPPEDGDSFAANAYIKASALENFMLTRETLRGYAAGYRAVCVIADDSGLCVDALGGEPGVRSARYTGSHSDSDEDRYRLVLSNLGDRKDRSARFVCALCCVFPDGTVLRARGECEGEILFAPQGDNGFGYDPIFRPAGYDRSMAELTMDEKNAISHRGKALVNFRKEWEKLYADK